ncbi:uncharacterized protein LOC135959889 [Calliphora vicina]|uniref:uncharacterized protein LOC135959889 n=1 Tax=Calliphora vicina TaxID=7373 RepID=UPI00325C1A1D
MKTIICHLLFLVVALSLNHQTDAAAAEVSKKAVQECIKEGGLNGDDTKRIMADELFSPKHKETSEKLQCFLLCCYKKLGLIAADGKQNPEAAIKYLQQRYADKKDKIKPALAKCANIKNSNPCSLIYEFEGCILKNIM